MSKLPSQPKSDLVDRFKSIPPTKVLGYGIAGMIAGAAFVIGNHLLSDDPIEDLDPPAPTMKKLSPEIHSIMYRMIGSFFRLCPQENRESYKANVISAIRYIEAFLILETQLLTQDPKHPQYDKKSLAQALSLRAMKKLRNAEKKFDSSRAHIKEACDAIAYQVAVHRLNIEACFE